MARLLIAAIVVAVVFTVYAVIDCAMTDPRRTRALGKPVWIGVVLLVPLAGPLLWLFFGKLRGHGPAGPVAPDDDEAFLRSLGSEVEHRERMRRLEAEIAALDEQFERPDADPGVSGEAGVEGETAVEGETRDDEPDEPRG